VTRIALIRSGLALLGILLLAGCGGDDSADQYFQEIDKQEAKDAETTKQTGSAEPEVVLPEIPLEPEPRELDGVPPPKLAGIRELRETYSDDTPRVVRRVKFYTDDSTVNHGNYTEWHPNGQKSCEGEYSDGKRGGVWTYWFEDGKKAKSGRYKDGKPSGNWTYWRPDGTKDREESYRDGKRHGRSIFYNEKGKPKQQGEYNDGLRHGTWTRWFDSGQKAAEGHYVNGKLHGTQTVWFENGKIGHQAEFVNGKRDGKIVTWNEAGEKVSELIYDNDVLLKRKIGSGTD